MKVSFIIPAYNVEKFLPRCIDSILAQTVRDWEAIFVNDGSTDSTPAILHKCAARDSRITVIDEENSGLSAARNAGLEAAEGDFVVFVDSDDFIHPQTLEIALSIQERSGADIVSWYKDSGYRSSIIFRHLFHLDTIAFRPAAFKKRYDSAAVEYEYTDDIFSVATDMTHQKEISRPLKHCYVWRHLIRRDILEGICFEKGLTFEDFPWWSSVMLRNPSVAYNSLPLYFYNYNPNSIDVGSKRIDKVISRVRGLEIAVNLYSEQADSYRMECWNRNFKWPVIRSHIACYLPVIKPDMQRRIRIAEGLRRLRQAGAFDNPPTKRDEKAVRAIDKFISKYLESQP